MPTRLEPEGVQGTLAGVVGTRFGTQAVGAPTTPAVGASPVTFTNAGLGIQALYCTGVAATNFTMTKRGVVLGTNLDAAANTGVMVCLLGPGESVIITYSGAAPVVIVDTP